MHAVILAGVTAHPADATGPSARYPLLLLAAFAVWWTVLAIELLDARAPQRGPWRWLVPLLFVVSHATLYELMEWGAAMVFSGGLGEAYLGTQGDAWDAQKDAALAALGAVVAVPAWRWRQWRKGRGSPAGPG